MSGEESSGEGRDAGVRLRQMVMRVRGFYPIHQGSGTYGSQAIQNMALPVTAYGSQTILSLKK